MYSVKLPSRSLRGAPYPEVTRGRRLVVIMDTANGNYPFMEMEIHTEHGAPNTEKILYIYIKGFTLIGGPFTKNDVYRKSIKEGWNNQGLNVSE